MTALPQYAPTDPVMAVEDYYRTMGPEYCPISPTGRHSYVYIYPDGHAATGAKYS